MSASISMCALTILGGGPAGLAVALYAHRALSCVSRSTKKPHSSQGSAERFAMAIIFTTAARIGFMIAMLTSLPMCARSLAKS